MKKIGIVGFNIFAPGGTTRSNLNLIKEFSTSGYEVTLYNLKEFSISDLLSLRYQEGLDTNIRFKTIRQLTEDQLDVYFITRESFFSLAEIIHQTNPKSMIIGEIHAPLDLIEGSFLEDLAYFTAIRVATEAIKIEFIEKYKYKNVFVQTISLNHLKTLSYFEDQKTTNLFIHSRFDERQKDISYGIKLMDYLVNHLGQRQLKLYINGYGVGEVLYKNLIGYYNLQQNVLLNEGIPKNYVYLSTARYETLGFSIIEAISSGHKTILYGGNDNVIADIYKNFSLVSWLNKTVEEDAMTVLDCLDKQLTKENYFSDVSEIKRLSLSGVYADTTLQKVEKFSKEIKRSTYPNRMKANRAELVFNQLEKIHQEEEFKKIRKLYTTIKDWPLIKPILKIEGVRQSGMNFLKYITALTSKNNEVDQLDSNCYFIESFHGKNFSGDPKYIALAIAEKNPNALLFVSSVNQLVDIEILEYGFTPIRMGSKEYITIAKMCKVLIVNGNTLDKIGKNKRQIILQTWHGFPIKKMVNDLSDPKQRMIETSAFTPRMVKWDYLLTSSTLNTQLLTSAFNLSENKNLEILEMGAPRNEYLIRNKESETEKNRIHWKYFNRPLTKEKKYILFCPTWRKNKRKEISTIDLKKLIQQLPDEYELIIKLHPHESKLRKYYKSLSPRIHCFFNELVDIQELYLIAEMLISDYSSAIIDYAHVGKKLIILQEDKEDYAAKVGWYLDIEEMCQIKASSYSEKELRYEILRETEEVETIYQRVVQKELMLEDKLGSAEQIWQLLKGREA